jgi:hypothetical protein
VLEPFSRDFTGFDPVSHIQPTHGNEIDASKSQAQLTIDMDMSRQLPESQPPELTAISYRAEEGLVTGGKVAAEPRLARKVFAGLVALGRAIGGRERDLVELAPEINESPKYRLGAIGALSGEKLALPALAKPALANGGALGAQVGMPGLGSQTALFQVNKLLGFNNAKKATPKIAKPLSVQANGPRRGDCLKKAANRRLPPRARQGIGSLVMVRTAAYSRFRRSLNPTKNYFPVGIPKEPFVEVPAPCLPKDNIGDTPMAKSDERPIFAPVVSLCGKVILSLNGLGSIF